jgi:hypothetical protein
MAWHPQNCGHPFFDPFVGGTARVEAHGPNLIALRRFKYSAIQSCRALGGHRGLHLNPPEHGVPLCCDKKS